MIPSMGGTPSVARRVASGVIRLARAAWGSRRRAARGSAVDFDALARAYGLTAAERRTLRSLSPGTRERFCRACQDGRRVSVGARLDRSEFARSLSRAGREARGFGAIYGGATTIVIPRAEPADADSGVRLAPLDESPEPTYDATADAEADDLTPRAVYREPEARQ